MKEFTDPITMARILSRKRIAASKIHAMVKERFGYAPSRLEIMHMKGISGLERKKVWKASDDADDKYEYLSEADHRQMMKDGCDALLRALWYHHGPILAYLKLNGKNVVFPDET
jgi:hypothetical protein